MTDSHHDRSSSLLQTTDGTSGSNSITPPPLPWAVAAVWGSFLHEGLMLTSNNVERTLLLLDRWGDTTLALVQVVCEYLPTLWDEVQPYYSSLSGVSGVFEYEVVSQLGEQIATHLMDTGKLPSQEEFELMTKVKPPPSASLRTLAPPLAFLTSVAESLLSCPAMVTSLRVTGSLIERLPSMLPTRIRRYQWTPMDRTSTKKPLLRGFWRFRRR
ncbi:hypothetical protein [Saccharospirillum mangrovi]|uniref:hypothetical protein n=1 Tax=Saccharospirillum mangrovi TaxID=2161747 RepID=UPI001300A20C|nr:hypothetical protein [Saccharospirillum mangrovi]